MNGPKAADEFTTIAQLLRPLARAHPAALDARRNVQALAVLRDRAAGDVDAETGEDFYDLIIRQHLIRRLIVDQLLDPVADGFGRVGLAAAGSGVTRPIPLKVMVVTGAPPDPASTSTLLDPSAAERIWMMRGAATSDTAASQAPVGSSRLTTQLLPEADSAQAAVALSVK